MSSNAITAPSMVLLGPTTGVALTSIGRRSPCGPSTSTSS
jgi:hypothetical protein